MNKKVLCTILTLIIITSCMVAMSQDAFAPKVMVNGNNIKTEAKLIDDRVYVPIRTVSEALGAQVGWDNNTKTALINTSGDDNLIPSIIKNASPYIVGIIGQPKDKEASEKYIDQHMHGTGFVIDQSGEILTNAHVVKEMDKIYVVLNDGTGYEAALKCIDVESDIALIKINKSGMQSAVFASEEEIEIGKTVIAIGTPVSFALRNSATIGIISGVNRSVSSPYRLIQTDATINFGNSGGPLVNLHGKVVGINSLKFVSRGVENLSFSIPVGTIKFALRHFREFGKIKRAYMGADFEEGFLAEYDLPSNDGLKIINFKEDSPAQKQGMKEDDIILAVNDEKVNSIVDYNELIKKYLPGDKVLCKIKRDGIIQSIPIVFAEAKEEKE